MPSPKIVAGLSFRYEPKWLVNQCLNNIKNIVDDAVVLDDTKHPYLWRDEAEYRAEVRSLARAAGADYLLIIDPDERFEKEAHYLIRQTVQQDHQRENPYVYSFLYRELWTPTQYRVDGIWGRKRRPKLFQLRDNLKFDSRHIQASPYPFNTTIKELPLFVYHLKMIEPQNRFERSRIFKELDPDLKYQSFGYSYLHNEDGLQLNSILPGKEYSPKYRPFTITFPDLPLPPTAYPHYKSHLPVRKYQTPDYTPPPITKPYL